LLACLLRRPEGRPGGPPHLIAALIACAFLLFGQSVPESVNRYPSPDDLVVSPDGKRLYVVCGGTDELVAIDPLAKSIAGRVPVGRLPRGVAIAPDGTRLDVTNSWSDTVTEIDAATLKVLRTLPAGFEPTGIAVDGRHGTLYVANRIGSDVSLIDLASGQDAKRLPAGRGASYVAASADGARMYVSHIYPNPGKWRTEPESEITEVGTERQIV